MLRKITLFFATAFVAVAASRAEEKAPLGVMTHFAQGWDTALVSSLKKGGIGYVRDELYWDEIEPKKGQYSWPANYDAYMVELRKKGVKPLIALTFGNRNYDNGNTPYTDEAIKAYSRYALEVIRHYGKQIEAVEIWNEYNGSFCTGPATQDRAGTYLRMLKVVYTAIKKERPDIIVVGVSTAGLPMPYLERIFDAGGLEFMDAVSVHPYRTASTPEGLELQMKKLNELISLYSPSKPKPIWVTEIGWGTRESQADGDLVIDETTQAKFLVRAFALLLSADVERAYWYLFRDYDQFATMGLVRAPKGDQTKPAYRALATMIQRLSGAEFVERKPTPSSLYAFSFERADDSRVLILWSLTTREIALPKGAKVYNINGDILSGPRLVVTDSPVYIEGEFPALPEATDQEPMLADSVSGFSDEQGRGGWSYGAFVGESLQWISLTKFQVTDWKEEWTGAYPYISVTSVDQHPAVNAGNPVAAVRRWKTNTAEAVRVVGYFKCTLKGDGVRVRILSGDRALYAKALGGGGPVLGHFDFQTELTAGGALDFAVDPGAAGKVDFDATEVSVAISRL